MTESVQQGTSRKKLNSSPNELEEIAVIEYLRKHPDILYKNQSLLAALEIPHQTGSAVSLVERQVKMLRQQNQKLNDKLSQLIKIARENEDLSSKFNRLAVELILADQLHEMLSMTQNHFQTFFDADYACFKFLPHVDERLIGVDSYAIDPQSDCFSQLKHWIMQRKPVCGEVPSSVSKYLFGLQVELGSCALVPLYHAGELGLLCLGSKNINRFREDMGTVFLQQLGELLSTRIVSLLV